MGYLIGGGLIVAAVAGAILFAVVSGASLVSTVDDFERVVVGEARTLQLEDRKYIVYYEGDDADSFAPALQVQITDAESGDAVDIGGYSSDLTYGFGDHEGSAEGTITPPRAGSYEVTVSGETQSPSAGVALGESISKPLVRTIVGTLAIGALLGFAGIALLIITGIRRSRARNRAAA